MTNSVRAARRASQLSTRPDELSVTLHPKQGVASDSRATETLYGGAAGGGKSYLMRISAIMWCAKIAGLQVYLFRRTRDDLAKNHVDGPRGFRALLAPWVLAQECALVEDEIRFSNGSQIFLCHCKDEKDIYKYQGAEIHVLLIDELTHFTETMYRFLRNRVRMVGIDLPAEFAGCFPRILCGANPGNIGHQWVKAAFIDGRPPLAIERMPASEGGMLRQFIPARLEDNPSMAADDPGYEARLEGLGPRNLVLAMRWGDWSQPDGAYFECWSPRRHVVAPLYLPPHWPRIRSADWGSYAPFSVGWWAVVSEPTKTAEGLWLPRGCLVRCREWYGMQPGRPNVGLKLPAEQVGARIWELERNDPRIVYGVLDPSAFRSDGGPTIAHRLTVGSGNKVFFRKADNARVPGRGAMGGWDQVRARLIGDVEGRAMLVVFSTCLDTIRTLPALQHDPARPEDVDTNGEDHAADDIRYACMSRPWAAPLQAAPVKPKDSWQRFLEGDDEDDDDEEVSWKVV
jgi:hypothetical protein